MVFTRVFVFLPFRLRFLPYLENFHCLFFLIAFVLLYLPFSLPVGGKRRSLPLWGFLFTVSLFAFLHAFVYINPTLHPRLTSQLFMSSLSCVHTLLRRSAPDHHCASSWASAIATSAASDATTVEPALLLPANPANVVRCVVAQRIDVAVYETSHVPPPCSTRPCSGRSTGTQPSRHPSNPCLRTSRPSGRSRGRAGRSS